MYKEEILDHYKRPRNTGKLETDMEAEGENASCGDTVHIYVESEGGYIEEIKHQTEGCAISTAAASIASQKLQGMDTEEVKDLPGEWMIEKLGTEISPMRRKCAVLALKAVQQALENGTEQ